MSGCHCIFLLRASYQHYHTQSFVYWSSFILDSMLLQEKNSIFIHSGLSSVPSTWLVSITSVGLPWWHSGWESTCQCRGHGFEPWSGSIPHAVEQLGPCATTTEPALQSPRATTTEPGHLEPVLCNERPTCCNEEGPLFAATRESPHAATRTQRSQIN